MTKLYEASTMDSPLVSDEETSPVVENSSRNMNSAEQQQTQTESPALRPPVAAHDGTADLSEGQGPPPNPLDSYSPFMISSRPRSPSAQSEMSRPDPPSIIDNKVLDDLNDEDWEEMPDESSPRGSSEKLTEQHVNGEIVQKALSQSNAVEDKEETVDSSPEAAILSSPSDLAAAATKDAAGEALQRPQLPLNTMSTENGQQESSSREPPAVLNHSASSTNIEALLLNAAISSNGGDADQGPHDVIHTPLEKENSKTGPDSIQGLEITAVRNQDGLFTPPEATPIMANGKSFARQNVPKNDTSQNYTMSLASMSESWEDAAQMPTLSMKQMTSENSTSPHHPETHTTSADSQREDKATRALTTAPAFAPASPPQKLLGSPQVGPPFATPHPHVSSSSSPPFMIMNGNMAVPAPRDDSRRKINLHLQEEIVAPQKQPRRSFLGHFRTRSGSLRAIAELPEVISMDRGHISVSWFTGTSVFELQEHVRRSVIRKMRLPTKTQLVDLRMMDESQDPPEEIVLSPHIPSGSSFTLRFSLNNDGASTPGSIIRPPESPSAAPAHRLAGISHQQMEDLTQQLDQLRKPANGDDGDSKRRNLTLRPRKSDHSLPKDRNEKEHTDNDDRSAGDDSGKSDDDEVGTVSEDPIEARLRQITELLIDDRKRKRGVRQEKRQVILVLVNYFFLFLGFITLSAELQARAPEWLASLEQQMKDVRDCSANQETLFECVSRGDFAGLVASVILWLSRSVIPRRIFLFGFESPKKLWTVVYESFVTAICWGVSYMFIRRGMNPDTRERFFQKYWKDAVYGSLAGFNAAFMKHVLKNLIPQEAVEDALRDRQLRFLSWIPSFE